jgi:hypothetical protein
MKKSNFYSILFVFVLVLVSVFQCNAQTEQFTFYFAPSESALSVDAMNVIDSMLEEGYIIEGAYGITNSLPNVSRGLTNDSLGHERALSVQDYCDCYIPNMGQIVMSGNRAEDRAVDIFFTKVSDKTIEIESEAAEGDLTVGVIVDSLIESDPYFAEENIDSTETIIFPIPTTDTVLQFDTITVTKSLEASKTTEEESSNTCECVEENIQELWDEYKSLQVFAKQALRREGKFSDSYKYFTEAATETRICYEFAKGLRSTKAKKNKHCANCGKSGQMSVSKKKKKKGRVAFKYTKLGRKLKNLKQGWTRFLDRVAPYRNC